MMKIKDLIEKVRSYIKETIAEMKKVVWPNQRYVMVATLIILAIVVILGGVVMAMDLVLAKIFGALLRL